MNVFSKSKIPGLSRRDLLAAAALSGLAPGILQAQDRYPSKPIKLIISSPAGSTFDSIGRAASVEAEKKLGQPIVLEYRSGAGGTPAFVQAKNAAPDGYTLVIMSLSTVRQPLLENVGYDGVKDFTWIASLAEINFGVVVQADSPFKTWADLLAYGKANPQKVSYGAPSGLGNSAHIFVSEVTAKEKLDWTAVPFRASNDCMTALLRAQLPPQWTRRIQAPLRHEARCVLCLMRLVSGPVRKFVLPLYETAARFPVRYLNHHQ